MLALGHPRKVEAEEVEAHSRGGSEESRPSPTSLGFGFPAYHTGTFQLQQSDLLGALEGSRELQVKSTQLPGWWGKENANRRGPQGPGLTP